MSRAEYTSGEERRPSQTPKFFVFDSETSGVDAHRDRVVELAVIEYVPGQNAEKMEPHSVLVNPRRKLRKKNIEIHGITDVMLKDEACFPEAWETFRSYVDSACAEGERPVLVAHNAQFDVNFLRNELHRNGLPVPDWDVSCSLRLVWRMWPGEPAKLADLTAKFSVTEYTEHRAGGDVQGLCKVLDSIDDIVTRTGETVQQLLIREAQSFKEYGPRRNPSSSGTSRLALTPRTSCLAPAHRTSPVVQRARSASLPSATTPRYESARVHPQLRDAALRTGTAGRTVNAGSASARARSSTTKAVEEQQSTPGGAGSGARSESETSSLGRDNPRRADATSTNDIGRVFVTATGSCFHVDEYCYGLRKTKTKRACDKSEIRRGLRACKVCCKAGSGDSSKVQLNDSPQKRQGSPRSVISASTDHEEAPYYRSPTGSRYHVRFDCYGLRRAAAKIPCDYIPEGLTPCSVCSQD